jgi:hypothetical protein
MTAVPFEKIADDFRNFILNDVCHRIVRKSGATVAFWRKDDTPSTEVGSCSYGDSTLATICCW